MIMPRVGNIYGAIRSCGACSHGAASLVCNFSDYLPTFQHDLSPVPVVHGFIGQVPSNLCAHRLAAGFLRKMQEVLPAQSPPVETGSLPEAPASLNFKALIGGYETQITLRDADEHRLLARLQVLLQDQRIKPLLPKPAPRPQGQWKQRTYLGA